MNNEIIDKVINDCCSVYEAVYEKIEKSIYKDWMKKEKNKDCEIKMALNQYYKYQDMFCYNVANRIDPNKDAEIEGKAIDFMLDIFAKVVKHYGITFDEAHNYLDEMCDEDSCERVYVISYFVKEEKADSKEMAKFYDDELNPLINIPIGLYSDHLANLFLSQIKE